MLRSKRKLLRIKINISKKLLLRLAIFTGLIAVAVLYDVYFEKDSFDIQQTETNQKEKQKTPVNIYLITQSNPLNSKSSPQKIQTRRTPFDSNEKLIQKYHQLRNYQVLKAEVETGTVPLISLYAYLVFQQHFFTNPDDDSLIF